MMDANKIQILVQEGEGLTVEFKEHYTPRIDEDIVAFANTRDGVILLGVRDDRTVSGEKLTNDLKARINSVARNCNPPVQIELLFIVILAILLKRTDIKRSEEVRRKSWVKSWVKMRIEF